MTRAILPEAKLFKEIIDTISKIADEVSILLAPDGLFIKALDVDQTSLIDVHLPREMFLEYEVEEQTNIGVSITNLKKVLKHVKKGENLTIKPEEDFVKFTIGTVGVVTSSFKFRNLDVSIPELPELGLNFTVIAKIQAQSLKKIIEDIEAVGGSTQIKATPGSIIFRSVGAGKLEIKLTTGSFALISLDVIEPAESIYDTTKLTNIMNVARVSDVVTLQYANKMPLKADFNVGIGRVSYLLAPFEVS
ncbi:MAG: DNA polymerase sliding clamp [Desulfurococcaceae archaeon]